MNNYGNGGACINFVFKLSYIYIYIYGSIYQHMRRNHWFGLKEGDFSFSLLLGAKTQSRCSTADEQCSPDVDLII